MTHDVYWNGKPASEMFTAEGFIRPDVGQITEVRRPAIKPTFNSLAEADAIRRKADKAVRWAGKALATLAIVVIAAGLAVQGWAGLMGRLETERSITNEQVIARIEARR